MSPNRFLILFLLPLLAACPAKSKSPLLFLGEMSASASLPTDWVQDAYLKASNAGAGDGTGVAIDGDIAVVGGDATNRVTVFKKNGAGDWIEEAILSGTNTENADWFGHSVAISGNYVIVGASQEDNDHKGVINEDEATIIESTTAANSGAVYIFKRDAAGNWKQDAYLKASNAATGANFGSSVAISGGYAVVGAMQESNSVTGITNDDNTPVSNSGSMSASGAAYVFKRNANGEWIQDAYLKAPNSADGNSFGAAVSIDEGYIAIAATYEDNGATGVQNADNSVVSSVGSAANSGSAYIYKRDSAGYWIFDAYLKASNSSAGILFGESIAIAGNSVIVGAMRESGGDSFITNTDSMPVSVGSDVGFSGAAYIFRRDASGNWIQDAYLKASNPATNDLFGRSVSISSNYAIVVAPNEDNAATIINGDDAIIPDNGTQTNSGAVYVFKKDALGHWVQDAYLKASNAGQDDMAHVSWSENISISGSTLVVGAFQEDNASTAINNTDNATIIDEGTASNSGAAYIFTLK